MDEAILKTLQGELKKQADFYGTQETQSLLGADPTSIEAGEGNDETVQLKNHARGSIGNLVLSQY